jgi:hypothetical protein
MQNQLQYPNNFNPQQPPNTLNQQKYNSPTHLKSFDKTLPSMNVKHYSSNPNLSLEVNGMKSSGIINDPHMYSPTINKKSN